MQQPKRKQASKKLANKELKALVKDMINTNIQGRPKHKIKTKSKTKKAQNNKNTFGKQMSMNKLMSELTPQQLITQHGKAIDSYAYALCLPERTNNAKIPGLYPIPTVSYHKTVNIPFVVSSAGVNPLAGTNSGKAVIAVNPYFLTETGVNYSTVLINNSSNLTLIANENVTGYGSYATNWGITAGLFQAYRLVSFSIVIEPQMSIQIASGRIAGGIMSITGQAGGGFASGTTSGTFFFPSSTIAANVDNAMYYHEANLTALESIRCTYFPIDPSFLEFIPLNQTHGSNGGINPSDDFYFMYYISGAPAGASFNLRLTANFELEPSLITFSSDIATAYKGDEVALNVVSSLAKNPELIQQSEVNIDRIVANEDDLFVEHNDGSFYDAVSSFVSNHSGSLLDITKFALANVF
jgi:hypothetical protein